MATQTRKRSSSRKKSKATPDLIGALGKRGPGRPRKPGPTALQIAEEFEAEATRLQGVAKILRGEA